MNYPSQNQHTLDDRSLFNLALLLILILSLIALVSLYASRGIRQEHPAGTLVQDLPNPFESVQVEAKSAIVVDLRNNTVLYEKDADSARPLASITKVMTAVTALDIVTQSSIVTIDKSFLAQEGDSGLLWGEKWELRDLLDLTLVESSNDAAAAIAAVAGSSSISESDLSIGRDEFISRMNLKAQTLGMTTASFKNETGLDFQNESGANASARDVATLFKYAIYNHGSIFDGTRLSEIEVTSRDYNTHIAQNTNKALNNIPNIIASKTGYTDLAGGNLAIVFDAGIDNPIAVIVLGSTLEGRFLDVTSLSYAALEYIRKER